LKNRWANFLLKHWIKSNETLINILQSNEYKMHILLDANCLLTHSKSIFKTLHEDFKLDLNYTDPNEIYEGSLMDRKTNIKYKLNKNLVKKATEVYEQLIKLKDVQSFMTANNSLLI
jgi:hypothetical protein